MDSILGLTLAVWVCGWPCPFGRRVPARMCLRPPGRAYVGDGLTHPVCVTTCQSPPKGISRDPGLTIFITNMRSVLDH
jgi:hypothetical protein